LSAFHAFQNESQVATIGDLTIENTGAQIAIHGDLTIARDKEGLRNAIALRDAVQSIVEALSGTNLPELAPEALAQNGEIKDPFS